MFPMRFASGINRFLSFVRFPISGGKGPGLKGLIASSN